MRVILQQASDVGSRKTWLSEGQGLRFGRTDAAQVVFGDDPQMSGAHFDVRCGTSECRLRDLRSTNGTFVNGQRVEEAVLRDGDEIRAGQTVFRVHIASHAPAGMHAGKELAVRETTGGGSDESVAAKPATRPSAAEFPPTPVPADDAPAMQPAPLRRVLLEFPQPFGELRKIWLPPGDTICFGRTNASDVPVGKDPYMSARHFVVTTGQELCRLRDAGSRGGTRLNGRPVQEAILCDGDVITAGKTHFRVHVDGGLPAALRSRYDPAVVLAVPDDGRSSPPPVFATWPCHAGISLFRAAISRFDPVDVARRVAAITPLFLIADPTRLDQQLPLPPDQRCVLYNWLPTEAAAESSPVILPATVLPGWGALLGKAWGQDAVICVYSQASAETLAGHLQGLADGSPQTADPGNAARHVLAYGSPSALAELLAQGDADFARSFFSQVDAVVLEVHGGDRWGLLAPHPFARHLPSLGFLEVQRRD